MQLFHVSDQKIIEGIRKGQRYGRQLGACLLLAGLIGGGLLVYWVNELYTRSAAFADDILRVPHPTTQQAAQQLALSANHVQFMMGLVLGFVSAEGLFFAVQLAFGGLILLLGGNRRDRLLLKCWDSQRPAE